MNKIIGIVGYPGAGKTFISNLMKTHFKFGVFYADRVGHTVLGECKDEIVEVFGSKAVDSLGSIDRTFLADVVFNDSEKLEKLNSIVHPGIFEYARGFAKSGGKLIIDAALIFETRINELCDEVWFIDAPFLVRLARVKERGWDGKDLLSREMCFLSEEELRKRSDRVLVNIDSTEVVLGRIRGFLE